MIRFFGLLVMLSLFIPKICISQEAIAKADLISAIGKLSKRDVSLIGSISEEVQEQPVAVDIAGGPQRVVIRGTPFGATNEFRGDAEVLVVKNGELVIASKEQLPGVKVFKSGEDVLSLQVHLKEPLNTAKLISNVSSLVDWIALANAVESASEIHPRVKGKETEFRVILDSSLIPNEIPVAAPAWPAGIAANIPIAGGAAGGNAQIAPIRIGGNPMIPTIVELAATFKINAAKEIVRLEYALQYNDPIKGLAVNVGGGGGVVQFNMKPAGEADLGKLIVYDFDVVAKPSETVVDFVNQAKTMLKNRK
jgi:hypothetical protein